MLRLGNKKCSRSAAFVQMLCEYSACYSYVEKDARGSPYFSHTSYKSVEIINDMKQMEVVHVSVEHVSA